MAEITTINLGFVNCYLVKTDGGFILVDTGMAFQRARLRRALDEAGCRPGELALIVLTHGDLDHVGNAVFLHDELRSRIALHPADDGAVASFEGQSERQAQRRASGSRSGLIMRLAASLLNLGPIRSAMQRGFSGFTPDVPLAEGLSLKAFGWDATVLHLPGHTPGSIGIVTTEGDAIVGDLLRFERRPIVTPLGDDRALMAEQARRLKALNLRTAYPGHGKPFRMEELMV